MLILLAIYIAGVCATIFYGATLVSFGLYYGDESFTSVGFEYCKKSFVWPYIVFLLIKNLKEKE